MKLPPIFPLIIMLMMWGNIIHGYVTDDPILWWEWAVTIIYSVFAIAFIADLFKKEKE